MKAMIEIRPNQYASVDVYRNGDVVTVVGAHKMMTESGPIETVVQSRMSVRAFEDARAKARARFGMAYTRVAGLLKVDDDIRNAPPLPNYGRMLR